MSWGSCFLAPEELHTNTKVFTWTTEMLCTGTQSFPDGLADGHRHHWEAPHSMAFKGERCNIKI